MFDFTAARLAMVECQVRTNDVTNIDVQNAMRLIPREVFLPKEKHALAYSDANIETQPGRYMLSPREFSKMVQAANISSQDAVLNIGCGSGYSCAVIAQLADTVIGLEDSAEMVELASDRLAEQNIMNAVMVQGDLKAGAPEHGPFDIIFVNGAVHKASKTWLDQLTSGGRLIVVEKAGPVGQAVIYTGAGDSLGRRVEFDAQIPYLSGFEPIAEFSF